jgi:flagellar motor switch protein FliN/FliY
MGEDVSIMDNQNNKVAVRAFATAFANAISGSLEQAIGSPWPLEVVESKGLPSKKADPVQFRLKVEGGLHGECFVEFYEPQISELLSKLGGREVEPVTDAEPAALTTILTSAAASLNASLSSQYGDLTFKVDSISGLAFGGMFVVPLAAHADQTDASVLLYLDGKLLDALSTTSGAEESDEGNKRLFHPSNLKLVMDVELNVSLRFGQRQLPLREVLELTSGSVIELDRMVDEPVELLLDGKLVARGEAVIVDGNYGLRVTEIPQAVETHFLR